ncbi:unnamed protein product [Brachionus calyciflorus]|uniref:RRM domain-containing protein n=1 Tax=Brachionus calyciflorus TaxID=104777 RepID=A0A814AZR0_9BILA|nr:unnamed protein product [Brachionus calyciflorus]
MDINNNENYSACLPGLSLMEEIFYRCNYHLQVDTCLKLEELINSKKLKLEDVDETLCELLDKADINRLFDEFEYDQFKFNLKYQKTGQYEKNILVYFTRKWLDSNTRSVEKSPSGNVNKVEYDYVDSKLVFYDTNPGKFNFELFIGQVPRDFSRDNLREMFEKYGKINYFVMRDGQITKERRNFAFVGYDNIHNARTAMENLNNSELAPNKHIKVRQSESQKKRIYFDKIPHYISKEMLEKKFSRYFENIKTIHLFEPDEYTKDIQCFLEFELLEEAEKARNKLSSIEINFEEREIKTEPTEQFRSKIEKRKLYIQNLSHTTTVNQIFNYFIKFGRIIFLRKKENFAFIEYEHEEDATRALDQTNESLLDSKIINVQYALFDRTLRKNENTKYKRKFTDYDKENKRQRYF